MRAAKQLLTIAKCYAKMITVESLEYKRRVLQNLLASVSVIVLISLEGMEIDKNFRAGLINIYMNLFRTCPWGCTPRLLRHAKRKQKVFTHKSRHHADSMGEQPTRTTAPARGSVPRSVTV